MCPMSLASLQPCLHKCTLVPSPFKRSGYRRDRLNKLQSAATGVHRVALAGVCLSAVLVATPVAASELILQSEPANALSLPTWIIHVSSVLEWVTAMGLIWRYGEVSGNSKWKGMTWGMLPCLGGALCACTWHFFYNSPELEFLVTLQSALTFLGNCTCGVAAYRIYTDAQQTSS